MMDKEVMQQALDALTWCYDVTEWPANGNTPQDKAIEALRARLAQPEHVPANDTSEKRVHKTGEKEHEPLAWLFQNEETGLTDCVDTQQVEWGFEKNNPRWQKIAPLFTAPPQREWVGLTDEEIGNFVRALWPREATGKDFIRAIEAKLREKNT